MGQSDFMREVSKEVKGEHPCPRHLCRRIPLLDHVNSNGSNVLTDRGYDCNKLIDYIYAMEENQRFLLEKVLNLNAIAIGGFTKRDIW